MDDGAPCCRICFDSTETPGDPLFRPCLCKGTQQWVHMSCLDGWRRASVNPSSFYACDTCKFTYKMGVGAGDHLLLARLLATAGAVHALALSFLLALIFVGGFVGKALDPSLDWMEVVRCFNLHHLIAGTTTTGLASLMGWATSLGGVGGANGWRYMLGDAFADRGSRDNLMGTLITAAAVIAGLCIAFSWIYGRLEEWARTTLRHAQHVVLDAQGGPPPPRRPPGSSGTAGSERQPEPEPRYQPVD